MNDIYDLATRIAQIDIQHRKDLRTLLVHIIRAMDANGMSNTTERKLVDLILNSDYSVRDALEHPQVKAELE